MTLLQIHDPKQKHQELVVGIDFGTTNSLIAFSQDHKPFIIGDRLIPSILNFDNSWSVGSGKTGFNIFSIKRILGKTYSQIIASEGIDRELKAMLCDVNGALMLKVDGQLFEVVELASLIFVELKKLAETQINERVEKAVITVPAYFDDRQKSAVKKAAKLAGIDCLRLLSEPTAAGFAYGINGGNSNGSYVVYDFGGGTFDVSLLRIEDKITQVIAVIGNDMLGGDDIDSAICSYLAEKFGAKPTSGVARLLKEELSAQDVASIEFNNKTFALSCQEYDLIAASIVEKTALLAKEVIGDCADIKGIVLVGGSSRVPLVKKRLSEFGLPIFDDIDPDRAVALGAALQAENLSRSKSHVLLDVVSLSLGIEVMGGLNEKIIFRNTPIPTHALRHFTTHADNQSAMKLHIIQGERDLAGDCRSIGFFELKGIPLMAAGMAKIEVSFMVDVDGLLYVSASESSSGITQELIINTGLELSENKITQILNEAMEKAKTDHESRLLKEAVLKAENFIEQVRKILKKLELNDLQIYRAITDLQESVKAQNIEQIEMRINSLDELFSPVCAKHFNTQISALLQGNKI